MSEDMQVMGSWSLHTQGSRPFAMLDHTIIKLSQMVDLME